MRLIEWPRFLKEGLSCEKPAAFTVGVFDGVHLGHRAIIEKIVLRGASVPVLVTFRQPRHKKKRRPEYPGDISSFRQKITIFEKLGVSAAVVIDFSESWRRMGGAEFLTILRERGGMDYLAVGSNFRCGYERDTDAPKAAALNAREGVPTDIVEPLAEGGEVISSSLIRAAVAAGRLEAASRMLGYRFTLDLGGAAAVNSSGGAVYNMEDSGRVLPPDGAYKAFVVDKNGVNCAEEAAQIFVEGRTIRIGGGRPHDAEYLEFLSGSQF